MSTDLAIVTNLPIVVDCRKRAALIKAEADAIVVATPERKAAAGGVVSQIARLKHDAEAERIRLVKPLKDQTSVIDRTFKDVLAPVLAADEVLRKKILDFDIAERRRAAEAAAKAERERLEAEALEREAYRAAESGKENVAEQLVETAIARSESATVAQAQAVAPPKTTATPMGTTMTVKKVWTHEVMDLGKVPVQHLIANDTSIRAVYADPAVKAALLAGGEQPIPGVRIFQRDDLSVRR